MHAAVLATIDDELIPKCRTVNWRRSSRRRAACTLDTLTPRRPRSPTSSPSTDERAHTVASTGVPGARGPCQNERMRAFVLLPLALAAALLGRVSARRRRRRRHPAARGRVARRITIRQAVGSYQVRRLLPRAGARAGCTAEEIAGCTLVTCAGDADPVAATSLDAGAISVSTAQLEHTLALGADGFYEAVSRRRRRALLERRRADGERGGRRRTSTPSASRSMRRRACSSPRRRCKRST